MDELPMEELPVDELPIDEAPALPLPRLLDEPVDPRDPCVELSEPDVLPELEPLEPVPPELCGQLTAVPRNRALPKTKLERAMVLFLIAVSF
jgi:hypothetical protein